MATIDQLDNPATVYWHRELPPLDAEPIGVHTLEATSSRVPGTLGHRDDLWDRCYHELMVNAGDQVRPGDCAPRRPFRACLR